MRQNNKALRLLALLFRPIETNFVFFVFMFVLGLVCASHTNLRNMGLHEYAHTRAELFVDLYAVCLVLTLLPRILRKTVRFLLYIILYATAVADVFCFVKFGSTLTPTMLLLLGETNTREAGEFLSSYVNADVLLSAVGWVLLVMLLNVVFSILLLFRGRLSTRWRMGFGALKDNYERLKPVLGVLTVAALIYSGVASARNKTAFARIMTLPNVGAIEHELTRLNDCVYLYQPIYRLVFSLHANSMAAEQIEKLIEAKDRVAVDSCSFTSPNIVLIIGESYNRHHSQLYGYGMETTPRQYKMAKEGSLVKFTDVVAPWNLTSFVFKNVFSLHVVGEKGEWCDYPLFPEVFRKAGYHVSFLTNQFLPKAKDAVYDFSGGFFLNTPELSAAQFDTRNSSLYRYDGSLLDAYQQTRKENTAHNLIIFHLMGQHVAYKSRCPADHRKFTPDDYNRPDLNRKQLGILSDYDNAILYNDYVVSEIISKFEDRDAVVVYFADHGEECFDGKLNTYGRLHSAEIDARLAREEFDIPMWIWCSKKYRKQRPELFKTMVQSRKRRYMTDALPHLLMYLAGISTKDYHSEYNILSPDYNEMRPRLIKGATDYDKLGVEP